MLKGLQPQLYASLTYTVDITIHTNVFKNDARLQTYENSYFNAEIATS